MKNSPENFQILFTFENFKPFEIIWCLFFHGILNTKSFFLEIPHSLEKKTSENQTFAFEPRDEKY